MKVRLPVMVQDPETARFKGMPVTEGFDADMEEFWLDGPVTRRLAVLDFDPKTGILDPGVPFVRPTAKRKLGGYELTEPGDVHAPDFLKVSLFATVLKTMYMYEEPDNLGRELTWAFGAPQLLLVPRAGEWANAFYERDSHSIQFFYFTSGSGPIYTALSRDIVAHETGHAILDGIAPDLYNAISPQSLALHEAMADLTALIMAFRSHTLRETVLEQTNGSIQNPTAFASIAEEFGLATGRQGSLRDLVNDYSLDPTSPNAVARDEPHELSQVLSGALYSVMRRIHEQLTQDFEKEEGLGHLAASGRALAVGAERFKRMVIRALDYLPPGEVSFSDYARALLAADQASHPATDTERKWICQEFERRGVVDDAKSLQVTTNFDDPALRDVDLATLVESDWAAYSFATANRELLGIPPTIPFQVRPRLDVTKRYHHRDGAGSVRECIYKVAWDCQEPNDVGGGWPSKRVITVGTTLAIDWASKQIRARLTSGAAAPGQQAEADRQKEDRSRLLTRMIEAEVLQPAHLARGPDGRPLRSVVAAQIAQSTVRVRGVARMLHLSGGV